MPLKKTKTLKVNDFEFIQIQKNYKNIESIMSFCGLHKDDAHQEMIYFQGGDVFIFKGANDSTIVIGDESMVKELDYIIKKNGEVTVISQATFVLFFKK